MCDMTHPHMRHRPFIHMTCLIHMWDMTHLYVFTCVTWHTIFDGLQGRLKRGLDTIHSNSTTCVTWLIHTWYITHSSVWHASFICETWIIYMWDMTHSYVRHVAFICRTWLIHMCDMTHSSVWHASFTCETWHIHKCDMTHSYIFTRATWLTIFDRLQGRPKRGLDTIHSNSTTCVTWLIHTWYMTHLYVFTCVTWLTIFHGLQGRPKRGLPIIHSNSDNFHIGRGLFLEKKISWVSHIAISFQLVCNVPQENWLVSWFLEVPFSS